MVQLNYRGDDEAALRPEQAIQVRHILRDYAEDRGRTPSGDINVLGPND
jgi:hypothetical protein